MRGMVQTRSNPRRPTIKESNRFLAVTIELRTTRMIPNPDRHCPISIEIELQLTSPGVPFDLETSVTARNKTRCNQIARSVLQSAINVKHRARQNLRRDRH